MKRKIILILGFFYLCLSLFAQDQQIQRIIPPSPNAASLAKYAEIPVNTYNGIPEISIPLYEIKEGDINVPISISYHASGVKVEEEASDIGLNWVLNSGGLVTKSIMGRDDEEGSGYINVRQMPDPSIDNGYIAIGGSFGNLYLKDPACNPIVNRQRLEGFMPYGDEYGSTFTDWQPDRYFYNIGGQSGKFILNRNGEALLLDQKKIKIETIKDELKSIIGWSVTTGNGHKYTFMEKEKSNDGITGYEQSGSWYLSKITSPSGHEVNFIYEHAGVFRSQPSLVEVSKNCIAVQCPDDYVGTSSNSCNILALKKIIWGTGQIIFDRDTLMREDMTVANKLNSIKIYSSPVSNVINSLLKEFVFKTSYFVTPQNGSYGAYSNHYSKLSNEGKDLFDRKGKRLRLDEVFERKNNMVLPVCKFTYNNITLPNKTSYDRDHYGFYNNASNTTLLPPVKRFFLF